MDMDGMDMSMDSMSSSGMFQATNMSYAYTFWYLIAAVMGMLMVVRLLNYGQNWARLRNSKMLSTEHPTKPKTWYFQAWATLTAVGREVSYPQLYIPSKRLSWLTPPPMGRVICLFVYWAVIIYMMTAGAVVKDAYFWERIGFRNAWVTVTQVPLLYLLSSKTSIIALLAGSSYERLNWLHRWVARTMFVTATVHGFHFWSEWVLYDYVDLELAMMPSIRYGLGAWGILLWMVITSLKPFRSMAYEIFVLQHILAAIMFLWVIYVHVPAYAQYNIWFAIAVLVFDRVFRFGLLLWQNIKLNPNPSRCKGGQRFGHQTQTSSVGDSITILTIKDVHFTWNAGQHLYLWLPQVGPLEAHPFTIACAHQMPETCICNSIQLVIRSHSGFSKRLHSYAKRMEALGNKKTLTAFVSGPYGRPPRWDIFETLVLVSASTGASFTLPILESVLQCKSTICTKRIDFLLTARQGEEIGFYLDRLHDALNAASEKGITLSVHIAVTGNGQLESFSRSQLSSVSGSTSGREKKTLAVERTGTTEKSGGGCCSTDVEASAGISPRKRLSQASNDSHIHHSTSRPDVASFIRCAVEATGGETGIVVCGGTALVARVRTSVAKLSDERAVHKGTGAQGIHLHVEEYCF
ncbi:hypothetical protein PFICI_12186 [Pestalotiopsis fici W106-1]|uniref:ferric-chelate reductase (NADPH) n=1 Tax=Pestalotiopsis fici (strain W106-1 / CGMCC3.15140) TaxID=1229662 RepID=W3WSL9_PESFW|nr:uncharacterized protein PFICI_12186 [Pestalotiopsis fici W106-1]ETS76799.1 hypothetical protein PFICI_12186 [Pestalotiopsis fici W106-1]